jgi:uncharacterized protein YjbI with pentapeptide repeats
MEPVDLAAPDPTLRFEGKFRLSMMVTPHRQYLTSPADYPVVTFTTEASKGMVFALYRVTNADKPNVYVLQATPTEATPMPVAGEYFGLMGSADDVQAMNATEYRRATQFEGEFVDGGKSIRLLVRNANRYMTARVPVGRSAPTLWLPEKGSMFEQQGWQLDVVQRWNAQSMAGADLRYVANLRELCRGTISFAGARLERADFSNASVQGSNFTGARCEKTNFIGTELSGADFTGATITGAWLGGADAGAAKFPRVRFTDVNFDTFRSGRRTSFAGAMLEDAVLDGCNFGNADFTGGRLARASFLRATLKDTDFTTADLSGAKFGEAKAGGALFVGATMTGALLPGAELAGANFARAKLTRASFDGAHFDLPAAIKGRADFTGAVLYEIDFSGCDLRLPLIPGRPAFHEKADAKPDTSTRRAMFLGATIPLSILGNTSWRMLDLTRATITGSLPMDLKNFNAEYTVFPDEFDLTGRDITGATFLSARMVGIKLDKATSEAEKEVAKSEPNFSGADLRGASMSSAFLEMANFTRAIMHGINMSSAQLSYAKFDGARLDSMDDGEGKTPVTRIANLSFATLVNASFSETYLGRGSKTVGANLSYVKFYGDNATLANATLDGAVFSNAYLAGVNFTGGNAKAMEATNFTGACLANCKFNKASLQHAALEGACLLGADFTDASLNGATMGKAAIGTEGSQLEIIGIGSGRTLTCGPTIISRSATDGQTICPATTRGPCDGAAWKSPDGPMKSWTYGRKMPAG